jgi:TatD DNase family protein
LKINIHSHHADANALTVLTTSPLQSHAHATYSCGLHPWDLQNAEAQFTALEKIAQHKNCIAIGECGLDKLCNTSYAEQLHYFQKQILLANQIQKPLIIHCVKSSTEILKTLQENKCTVPIVIHGFNQNKNLLGLFLQQGFYISIGAAVLKHNSNAQKAMQFIPQDQLFLETDDDANISIQHIYQKIAELKNNTIENLEKQIQKNFQQLFQHNP